MEIANRRGNRNFQAALTDPNHRVVGNALIGLYLPATHRKMASAALEADDPTMDEALERLVVRVQRSQKAKKPRRKVFS